jgi:hypothetical protein
LTKAAKILTQSDIPIIDLAISSGYETGESFTKAFKKAFGVPPSIFKKRLINNHQMPGSEVSNCTILVPWLDTGNEKIDERTTGRKAYSELTRLSDQVHLADLLSTWISVFPHFLYGNIVDKSKTPHYRVRFGSLEYEVKTFRRRQSFQIFDYGNCCVLYDKGKPTVFKKAKEVIPFFMSQNLRHLPHLPVQLRAILLVPHKEKSVVLIKNPEIS